MQVFTEQWRVFGASVQGALHRKSETPNQDAWGQWMDAASSCAAVAVADGHGAARHFRRDIGARAAVDAALAALRQLATMGGTPDQGQLQAISADIERRWNELVAEHLSTNPMETSEMPAIAYGSTLLAALRRFTKMTPMNTVAARQRIANAMIEANRYVY